jgi:hypothetical protein
LPADRPGLGLRSYRLPEFVLGAPPQLSGPGKQHIDGHADERVLRDPLTLSPTLAVQRPAQPRQLVELVGPEPQLLALEPLPLRSL